MAHFRPPEPHPLPTTLLPRLLLLFQIILMQAICAYRSARVNRPCGLIPLGEVGDLILYTQTPPWRCPAGETGDAYDVFWYCMGYGANCSGGYSRSCSPCHAAGGRPAVYPARTNEGAATLRKYSKRGDVPGFPMRINQSEIIDDIDAHIRKFGGDYSEWSVKK
jgi:hypothetical protein